MKVVVITVLILVLFFVSSLYMNHYITRSSEEVVNKIEKLEESIEKNNWEEAQLYMKETAEEWNKTKKVWLIFLEHYEIDKINIVLARLQKFTSIEKDTEALGEIAEFKLLVKHVVEKEAFKITNIL
ncbi:protein of unknown function [Anaerovirgula multivorans]|uniref:DUF4363 family protein n=1 Tax=Anaerovirgula multivorans TaxID=312168 RepID=A0A239EDH6_9FIRM|nr:DUF4363 family protein [Anaerovirgula multivorans]SNS41942.1 protein of unknown function [Anaerovirgula multivorans]